jgi:hypothetical protein
MDPKFMIFVVTAILLVPSITTTSMFSVYGATPTQPPTDTTYTRWYGPDNKLYSKVCITEFTQKSVIVSAKCLTCELDKKTLKQTNCPGGFKPIKAASPKDVSLRKFSDHGKYYKEYQIRDWTPDHKEFFLMSQKCELNKVTSKIIICRGFEQIWPFTESELTVKDFDFSSNSSK